MAFAGSSKILKPGGEKLDKFEETVSQVLPFGRICVSVLLINVCVCATGFAGAAVQC